MTSETIIHAAIAAYLRSVLPKSALVLTINNNPRSAADGARQKRMGLRAGTPDILIQLCAGRNAWIEVKAPKGTLSPAQKQFQQHCRQWGIPHAVCRSIDDARDFLDDLGIETREAAA